MVGMFLFTNKEKDFLSKYNVIFHQQSDGLHIFLENNNVKNELLINSNNDFDCKFKISCDLMSYLNEEKQLHSTFSNILNLLKQIDSQYLKIVDDVIKDELKIKFHRYQNFTEFVNFIFEMYVKIVHLFVNRGLKQIKIKNNQDELDYQKNYTYIKSYFDFHLTKKLILESNIDVDINGMTLIKFKIDKENKLNKSFNQHS